MNETTVYGISKDLCCQACDRFEQEKEIWSEDYEHYPERICDGYDGLWYGIFDNGKYSIARKKKDITKENLEMMCGVHGFSKEKTAEKVAELAEKFGLDEVMKQRAGKLSGGWQRRCSIAMALISEPKILFLDEPTLGLDVLARSELWDSIRELKGKVTVILTTHYMEEAEELSDRIGIMKDGCLLTVGSAGEIKEGTGKERLEDAFIAIVKGERK